MKEVNNVFAAIRKKPGGQLLAQGTAAVGFTVLSVLAIAGDNVVFGPLFLLLALYYLKKLLKKTTHDVNEQQNACCSTGNPDAAKTELMQMLTYYKRLLQNWQWIALFGWSLSAVLLIYAPSPVIVVTAGLAAYSTYAFIRCRQAVRRIETSPALGGKGGVY